MEENLQVAPNNKDCEVDGRKFNLDAVSGAHMMSLAQNPNSPREGHTGRLSPKMISDQKVSDQEASLSKFKPEPYMQSPSYHQSLYLTDKSDEIDMANLEIQSLRESLMIREKENEKMRKEIKELKHKVLFYRRAIADNLRQDKEDSVELEYEEDDQET